MLFSKRVAKL